MSTKESGSAPICQVVVSGQSMLPMLHPGDTVVFEVWPEEVCVGDLLVFLGHESVKVHRVISVLGCGVTTYLRIPLKTITHSEGK